MSMFLCCKCGGFADADDGCEYRPGDKLLCVDCFYDAGEDNAAENAQSSTQRGDSKPSSSQRGIQLSEAGR